MKKLIAALMTVLFLGSTTGLVLAQGTTPASAPVKTSHKTKKTKKVKKSKKSTTAPAASAAAPAAPATK
jgi:hypothetical protein